MEQEAAWEPLKYFICGHCLQYQEKVGDSYMEQIFK